MKYEQAALAVFSEALNRLGTRSILPHGELRINLELLRLCQIVHFEKLKAKDSIPFFIVYEFTNQPEPDDTVESSRLSKRPDFACVLTNEQAADAHSSRMAYSVECKRLGPAERNWVLNENYAERGMLRFMQVDHGYAKGCSSAAMIGYMQNMEPDDVLTQVNDFAKRRTIPSLTKAATSWAERGATRLTQDPLTRDFDSTPVSLSHLWLDLRHCTFEKPAPIKAPSVKDKAAKRQAKRRSK